MRVMGIVRGRAWGCANASDLVTLHVPVDSPGVCVSIVGVVPSTKDSSLPLALCLVMLVRKTCKNRGKGQNRMDWDGL